MEFKLNIIVIEDDDAIRELISQALQEKGHRVAELSSAESLQDLRDTGSIDIFVIDVNLPGEDGFSLATRLRETYPLVGIIMASARTRSQDKIEGYDRGADVYLSKPFQVEELCAAAAALGRRRFKERQHVALANPPTLILKHTRLRLLGTQKREISLTPTEGQLLAVLARAPSSRLAYWQIIEALGLDPQTYAKSNLEVRVVRLRKKLVEVGAGENCLESVRGEGYQLCCPVTVE